MVADGAIRSGTFNSRPHEEVDRILSMLPIPLGTFNSRPHEEVDLLNMPGTGRKCIFQFTTSRRGRPCLSAEYGIVLDLSIHDLTKRSTSPRTFPLWNIWSFNSRPHEEVDAPQPISFGPLISFNSRPHEEVDDCHGILPHSVRDLSIHDLTKRSTPIRKGKSLSVVLSIHDLTKRSTGALGI